MAQPQLLQDQFTRMIQDLPRDQLPPDAAWLIYDMIPNLGLGPSQGQGGRLAKRGGTLYASSSIAAVASSATSVTAMGFATTLAANNDKLYFMTDNNKFCSLAIPSTSATAPTQHSTSGIQSKQNFVELGGKLVVVGSDGTTAPKSWDGTTFGNLAGSPPAGRYGVVFKDRLVLGSTSALPNRSYFSALDDPTTWDTTNGWVDTLHNITGYAPLPNALIIFGSETATRIRGSIPPPGSDFIIDDPIFHVGCTFPKSIAVNGPLAAFCNEEGVWLTNGTSQPQDLTALCGVKSTYQDRVARRNVPSIGVQTTYVPAVLGGFLGNFYACFVSPSIDDGVTYLFLFNLVDRSCVLARGFTIANPSGVGGAVCMTPQVGDELYTGGGDFIEILSPMFDPTSSNKESPGGNDITPEIHTRYYTDTRSWKKRWRNFYADVEVNDAASDNPTLAVSYTVDPGAGEGSTYTSIGTISETTAGSGVVRKKLPIRMAAPGIAFKIAQTNNSSSTVISAILSDVYAREAGRV